MSLKINQLFSLQGKTALITGGSSGLGEGIALALGLAGAKIAIAARREGQLLAAAERLGKQGVEVTWFGADLSVLEESTELSQKVLNKLGKVDILVNAAGMNLREPFAVVSPKSWQEQLNVHLGAPFFLTQALAPQMKTQQWGRIINIASVHGLVASTQKSAYVAAKHGIIGLTKVTALENARTGITCNAICPGWVLTPLVQKQVDARAEREGISNEAAKTALVSEKQPSGEFVTPEQLAALAVFLCGPDASEVRGVAWNMDGGWAAQ